MQWLVATHGEALRAASHWPVVTGSMMEICFSKFHGVGNDFIVSYGADIGAARRGTSLVSAYKLGRLAHAICDRRTGLGADGFLVVLAPQRKENHARILFFNADGSEAEMSGNGIRCAAAYYLQRDGQAESPAPPKSVTKPALKIRTLKLETVGGVKSVRLLKARPGSWVFRVSMGEPVLDPEEIPFNAVNISAPVVGFLLSTSQGTLPVTVTSMGNPHCSTFVTDFDALDWHAVGREIENNALFPKRTNVEFVKVRSRHEIDVRFWERGVGPTASSGTGSCGAVVACVLNALTDRNVRVRTVAGILEVSWPKNGEVTLMGPAELIAHGVYFHRGSGAGRRR